MSRRKGSKNTYVTPAKQLAWDDLSAEEQALYQERARKNFQLAVVRRSATGLPLLELQELLGMKEEEI